LLEFGHLWFNFIKHHSQFCIIDRSVNQIAQLIKAGDDVDDRILMRGVIGDDERSDREISG